MVPAKDTCNAHPSSQGSNDQHWHLLFTRGEEAWNSLSGLGVPTEIVATLLLEAPSMLERLPPPSMSLQGGAVTVDTQSQELGDPLFPDTFLIEILR